MEVRYVTSTYVSSTHVTEFLCSSTTLQLTLTSVRLVVNVFTLALASVMLLFICSTPALHNNTFNILFLSSYVVDCLANLARITLKYLPIILCQNTFVQYVFSYGPSLATLINASEWYLTYATMCCGFFFNLDHMLLVVFPKHYEWISSPRNKKVIVVFVWVLPFLCVVPMFEQCCGSIFFENTMNPVFSSRAIEDVYDTVDMLLESFFYVPIIFIFNCITTTVLQWRYRKFKNTGTGQLHLLMDQVTINIPERNSHVRSVAKTNVLRQRRVVDELNLSLLNLIDQMVDAVGVVFYLLFWAGNNKWIDVDITLCMTLYDVTWEISTLNQPYIFLMMFPKIRRKLVRFYMPQRRIRPQRQQTLESSIHLS
ncbi:unnamed protein product [Bursaphelenchus okinawaensis]|uniref:G-protein coupled receptors family 1 profile domain-containing protein n=1 Tax=Bursaphelenchus okinawaensis TaxID=465554 RepID=A0A811KW88_9BILA|nr:unnamed protein product [Bursaphelenchus okinawaensis]CAG9112794.1 unnamed protein product [Bursaphelenchus okinawaensis]